MGLKHPVDMANTWLESYFFNEVSIVSARQKAN